MKNQALNLTIIGTGYVGLVSGACLAEVGHKVVCVDNDEEKIKKLKKGIIPIYEPGLKPIVERNVKAGRLSFSRTLAPALAKSQAVFIAVGTPSSRRGDGYADLSYVYQVAQEIAPHLKNYQVVIDKSTVPVGTAEQVSRLIKEKNSKAKFDVVSNPEFLKEGAAIEDFLKPDRVVIGANSVRARKIMEQIYSFAKEQKAPVFLTDVKSAELIKYASNAFLATKISFVNELSVLAEKVNANIEDVSFGMGLDQRIGDKFLKAGPGYGGSCFPKDVTALLRIAQENETSLRIVEAVKEANVAQKARMITKIIRTLEENTNSQNGRNAKNGAKGAKKAGAQYGTPTPAQISGKTVLFLGLTFKAETDDMRDASSLSIIPALLERGVKVVAHDPQGMEEAKKIMPEVKYVKDFYQAAKDADALVILTEWNEYRTLDLERLKKQMKHLNFIDLRNIYEPKEMKKMGFNYVSVGR